MADPKVTPKVTVTPAKKVAAKIEAAPAEAVETTLSEKTLAEHAAGRTALAAHRPPPAAE
ncbi:hypothetical protein IVA80_15220 [Bradyrhizobium sp. 139]|uniref:hypothetical protein n=1 Tax=Bradyrhizobium sp. 139 TaxID=2782616 RepID=UPI001FFA83DF|nr:hypothetical protein [Bradyrhizobium sp. 139]MCK1742174.1 hypothetical protein [Bradyrhizobium sp. 139]